MLRICSSENHLYFKSKVITFIIYQILLWFQLYLITGVTWLLFALANWLQYVPVWYLAAFVNSFQGVSLMVVFTCKASVRHLWRTMLVNVWQKRRSRRVTDVQAPAVIQLPGTGQEMIDES